MERAVLLLSGGLDSSTLLHYAQKRLLVSSIHALSFNYGQKHSRELEMARWQAKKARVAEHRVVDILFMKELLAGASALLDESLEIPKLSDLTDAERNQPSTYVPNRNMILLSLAAAYAESRGIEDLFYAAQAQDEYGYWDCTSVYLQALNRVLALNRRKPVLVHSPFIGMRKFAILKIGMELGVDYAHTWSCYRGEAVPCGTCPTCVERASAFERLDMIDPLLGQ